MKFRLSSIEGSCSSRYHLQFDRSAEKRNIPSGPSCISFKPWLYPKRQNWPTRLTIFSLSCRVRSCKHLSTKSVVFDSALSLYHSFLFFGSGAGSSSSPSASSPPSPSPSSSWSLARKKWGAVSGDGLQMFWDVWLNGETGWTQSLQVVSKPAEPN